MRHAVLLLVGLVTLIATTGHAQTPAAPAPAASHPTLRHVTVELDFKLGPKVCPGGEALVHDEVSRRLGWDPFEPAPDGIPSGRIKSLIVSAPAGLTATFELVDAAGVRQWDQTYHELGAGRVACERLIRSIASEIAGGLTSLAVPEPEPAPPSPAPAPSVHATAPPATVAPPAATAAPPPSPPPPSSSLHPRAELGLAVFGSFNVAPRPTFGGALHLGIAITPFDDDRTRLVFAGELRVDAPATYAFGVQTQLFAGSLVVCGSKDLGRGSTVTLGFLGCVVGTAGALSVSKPTRGGFFAYSKAYAALGARFGFEVRFASLVLVLPQIEILPTVVAPKLPQSEAVRVGIVTGTAGVAAAFHF
jgi:hypothetical protein